MERSHNGKKKIWTRAVDLGKRAQDITDYYDNPNNQIFISLKTAFPGEVVFSKLSGETSCYRSQVIEFELDEYNETKAKVEMGSVDLKDMGKKQTGDACEIRTDYLER